MLNGIYVRTYDSVTVDELKLVEYYQEKLQQDDWEVLVKIKEKGEIVEISLLFDEDVAYGIFAIVMSPKPAEVTFVNIVGEIAPERISELLGNLSNFGMDNIDLGDTLKTKVELKVGTDANPDGKTSQKEMLAVKTDKPPKIDGKLDDKCWKTAPQAIQFTHATTEKPVQDQTVVKLVYTDKSIYVAWHLYDSQPDKIVARQTKDQLRFANEDTVCFSIDPFHTHQPSHRIRFMVNPSGKKYIQVPPGRSKKPELTKRWKVAADIVSDGWVVEMEIPWQLLDYPKTTEPTHMGINFDRKQQRTGEHSYWSNIGAEKLYSNDGNWLRVLPPSKLSNMQGMIDTFEIPYKANKIAKFAINSDLNPVDGFRLGGGVELGKQWHADPFFFHSSGETIRRNIDITENNFGIGSRMTPNPFVYGSMSFSIHGNMPNYRLGGGVSFGDRSNLTYAVQLHRLTSVRDRDILLTESEQFLRAFFRTDFQDYYVRQGGVMALQWQHASLKHTLGLSLLLEGHESVQSLGDYTSVNWFSNGGGQQNFPLDNGVMHSLTLKYDFDTRENTAVRYDLRNRRNKNEWYNTFLVEHANSYTGSDYDFTRFVAHLRNYHPIGENHLNTRLKVGLSTTPLPFQRKFVLGGTGTLRGYSFREFVGNHGFLFNLEYMHNVTNKFFIVPFVDIGQAWENLEDIKSRYPKINLGIGFQLGIFRLNFARALEKEREYQANFKWSRTF